MVTWSTLTARIQTFPFDADDRSLTGPVLDPLLRDLGQANEQMFGTDPLSAIQAAWETAALGGPAPAVPTSDWLAAQDVADRADLDAIHALNAAEAQAAADAIPF